MEEKVNSLETLIVQLENYGKTSFELVKLKSVDKGAETAAEITLKMVIAFVFFQFVLFGGIGLAIFLGKVIGEMYLGFLLVAGGFGLIIFLLIVVRSFMKMRIKDAVLLQLLNQ